MKFNELLQTFSTFNFSKFSTFSKFQNIKVKAHIEYHNKSTQLKGSVPQTCQVFSGNSETFAKLQGERPR